MKKLVTLLLSLLALTGCTGTVEPPLPTLLAVGVTQGEQPQVALVETVLVRNNEEEGGGYTFLESSRQNLAAPAVDFDVTERTSARTQLVVLGRDAEFEGYIDFFTLSGIDPDDPVGFAPVAGKPRLVLSELDQPDDEDDALTFCPEALQVSRDGRYVALYNGISCRENASSDDIFIDIIDTREREILERIRGGTFGFVDTAPFLDQQNNRLYYLRQRVNSAGLVTLELDNAAADADLEGGLAERQEVAVEFPDLDQRDLTLYDETFLVLYEDAFIPFPQGASAVGDAVETTDNSLNFIDNLEALDPEVLILSDTRLTVHTSLTDTDEDDTSVPSPSGTTLDPDGQFAYLLSEGQVTRFDLLSYKGESFSGTLQTFELEELSGTGPVAYARGIDPEEAAQRQSRR